MSGFSEFSFSLGNFHFKLPGFINKIPLMSGFNINTLRIRSFDGSLIYLGQVNKFIKAITLVSKISCALLKQTREQYYSS